jgi:hypothetical protein
MSRAADRKTIPLAAALLLWGVAVVSTPSCARGDWSFPLSAGYDLYVHDYYLAESDTTEVIQEFNLTASAHGASDFGDRTQWYLRAGLSGGTELFRESLDTGLRLRTVDRQQWLRTDLLWLARQFQEGSEYSLSSDNHEGRILATLTPWAGERIALDLRGRGRYVEYSDPSLLELSYTDGSGGLYLRSPDGASTAWSIGGAALTRDYPDSSQIDREGFFFEGDYDLGGLDKELLVFHRSERRNIRDETARPSAWFHWTDLQAAVPLDAGQALLRASTEIWDYDQASGAWYDSWLVDAETGYRWGDILRSRFEVLATIERLDAGDEPETYWQSGLRVGAETLSTRLSGSASIELGRRWYRDDDTTTDYFVLEYSDYTYVAVWLMANWRIDERFSIEATANFEPESHTERDDNITLGFGSLRLVYRP